MLMALRLRWRDINNITSLFRDIDSGAHLRSTIEAYKKYLKSGDVADFPPDLIKLATALNARNAGLQKAEITQIVRGIEEHLKAKKETFLNDFVEEFSSGGRRSFVKFLASQNRVLAKTAQNKIASGKALSLNERIALRAEEAIETGKKSTETINAVKKVGKKAKSALTKPIDGVTKVATEQAAKAVTKGFGKLAPEALKKNLSPDIQKRFAKAFQKGTDQVLQNLAKQFESALRKDGKETPSTKEGLGKAFNEFVERSLQTMTGQDQNKR